MSPTAEQAIWCDDYTNFMAHQSRSWTASDVSLAWAGGVHWVALGIGGAGGAAASALFGFLIKLALGGSFLWGLLVFPVGLLIVYLPLAKDRGGTVTQVDRYRLRINYRVRQPKHFDGFGASKEPTQFQWQVILWEPQWSPPAQETDRATP